MFTLTSLRAGILAACLLTGCQTPKDASPTPASPPRTTRNNSYSLLHQLLSDEKRVGLLRFIKKESGDVKDLVKRIAATSASGAKLIESFAKQDQALDLEDIRLPPGEVATRDAIGATKEKTLLAQSGVEFEVTLLLTQTEALSYGWHLAKVAGENESDPKRARALAALSKDLENLYHETYLLLLGKQH